MAMPATINAQAMTCPTPDAQRVAARILPLAFHKIERSTRPPSSGKPEIMLKAAKSRFTRPSQKNKVASGSMQDKDIDRCASRIGKTNYQKTDPQYQAGSWAYQGHPEFTHSRGRLFLNIGYAAKNKKGDAAYRHPARPCYQ
jgi:hypothetical protein